jgi:hypothetical protein
VPVARRRLLLLGFGFAATGLLAACQSATPAASTSPPAAADTPAPTARLSQPSAPNAAAALAPASAGSDAAWQSLVQAAQAEKTVVLRGPPTAAVRTNLPKAFKDAFAIDVQYTGGPSGDVIILER